jgi:hypothetical protein
MIDQFLVAAVIYAQTILDQDVAVRDDVVRYYKSITHMLRSSLKF